MADRVTNPTDQAATTLAATVGATDLTVTVADGSVFATSNFYVWLEPDSASKRERVFVTSRAGNVLTIASIGDRYLTGSAAGSGLSHDAPGAVEDRPSMGYHIDTNDRITAHAHGGGSDGSAVDAADVTNTPAGDIVATDVQAAIDELDSEKAALAGATFTGTVVVPASGLQDANGDKISPILTAYKNADESVTSSATLQDDNHLTLSLEAGKTYAFAVAGSFRNNGGGGGLRVAMDYTGTFSSSVVSAQVLSDGDADGNRSSGGANGNVAATAPGADNGGFYLQGYVVTSTAGTLKFQWAQSTSDATATSVRGGATISAWEV